MPEFHSKFKFGDKVIIDGSDVIVATVIGFAYYTNGAQLQVSWWNSGALVEQWLADWRVSKKE